MVALDCWRWCRGDNFFRDKPTTYSLDHYEVTICPFFNLDDLVGADLEVLGDLEYHWVAFSGEGVALDLSGRERRFVLSLYLVYRVDSVLARGLTN